MKKKGLKPKTDGKLDKKDKPMTWNIKIGFNTTTLFILIVIMLIIILPLLCLGTGCLDTTTYYYRLNETVEAIMISISSPIT